MLKRGESMFHLSNRMKLIVLFGFLLFIGTGLSVIWADSQREDAWRRIFEGKEICAEGMP